MSVEEDTELRDLVSHTLETNGCLAKIRAQLRASIFLALDDDECLQNKEPFLNKRVKEHLQSQQGQIMFCLVREFLEFFNLDFTISVYEPESYMGLEYHYEGRCKIIQDLGIPQLEEQSSSPILLQLIQIAQSRCSTDVISVNSEEVQIKTCNRNDSLINSNIMNKNNSKICDDEINLSGSDNKSGTSISEQLDNTEKPNHISQPLNINKLDETFDLSRHSVVHHSIKNNGKLSDSVQNIDGDKNHSNDQNFEVISSPRDNLSSKDDITEKDDTFEGTSSIPEDSIKENLDKSLKAPSNNNSSSDSEKSKVMLDQTAVDSDFSSPVVKEGKHSKFDMSFEKLKLSPQKSEKLKAKNTLTSLSDLPPLPINKTRGSDMLLPSLYSKEFREKSASKDIDKMFDLNSLDNYEEDFMSGSEINLVLNKTDALTSGNSKVNLSEELREQSKLTNSFEGSPKLNSTYIKHDGKVSGDVGGNEKDDSCGAVPETSSYKSQQCVNDAISNNSNKNAPKRERNDSVASSITSDDFEFNSNLEEILNST